MAHCAICHKTFTGVGAFDLHRQDGKCVLTRKRRDGSSVSLREVRPGVWGTPAAERGQKSSLEGTEGAIE